MSNEVIADTSFVAAVAIKTDRRHVDCVKVFLACKRIYLPEAVLAEIAFLLGRAGGLEATAHFFRHLAESRFELISLEQEDFAVTAQILEKYKNLRLDFVDAAIAALATRLRITRILTLDQRDFQILRPEHADHFEILP